MADHKTTPSKVKRALQANHGQLSASKGSDGLWFVIGPGTQFWDKVCLDVKNFHSMEPLSWVAQIQKMEKPIEILTLHRGKAFMIHWRRRMKDNSEVQDGCSLYHEIGGSIYDQRPFRSNQIELEYKEKVKN